MNLELDLAVAAPHAVITSYAAAPDITAQLPVRQLMADNITLRFMLLYTVRRHALTAAIDAVNEGGGLRGYSTPSPFTASDSTRSPPPTTRSSPVRWARCSSTWPDADPLTGLMRRRGRVSSVSLRRTSPLTRRSLFSTDVRVALDGRPTPLQFVHPAPGDRRWSRRCGSQIEPLLSARRHSSPPSCVWPSSLVGSAGSADAAHALPARRGRPGPPPRRTQRRRAGRPHHALDRRHARPAPPRRPQRLRRGGREPEQPRLSPLPDPDPVPPPLRALLGSALPRSAGGSGLPA